MKMKGCLAAPPVMEFDQTGNVVNSWGDRQVMAEALHGCSFDAQGNIWIGVKGKVDSEDGTPKSHFLERKSGPFGTIH
jgi:hypothetical protein